MRDGLPIIALIVSAVALVIALAGALAPSGAETPDAPEEMLENALAKLQAIDKRRDAMREQISTLNDDIVEIKEASAGARGEAFNKTEIQNIVRKIVEEELAKRVKTEAAAAGARVGAKAAGSPAQQKFNAMLATIKKQFGLDDAKHKVVTASLTKLRAELNDIYGKAKQGKINVTQRDKLAAQARARADAAIAKALPAATMQKFRAWRRGADAYTKKFFGH